MGQLVSLVIVSHSRQLAAGVAELAAQMAPAVTILAAGGLPDGGIGTSFEAVQSALEQATSQGGQAVVLTDLGSAVLTTESVLEFLEPEVVERILLADAPLVEGAVAAAVEAENGADGAAVVAAAQAAGALFVSSPPTGPIAPTSVADEVAATVVVRNAMGLHARPAALLARSMAALDAQVTIDGVDGASVLALMALGATRGRELTIRASGAHAREAVDTAVSMIEDGFGEQ
ncbi:MAG: PTS-dependent dihydroxyacetone kinase phosphotransferase subunit DhaM [Actinobacteria bacterium]|nr:PTS-dependent dihydroxyacetone kinase phosphotransferase subunit DhaM [Actinomycetota bacterium]MCG2802754.1 PTS-dependent dihydroxyacetone kinase phosphotransferase subunit DhaM [Cellulomonas sp.]